MASQRRASRKTLEEIENETLRGALVTKTAEKYLTTLEDDALGDTDPRLLVYVQKSLAEGYSTEYIRTSLGITGGHKDRKWKKILRDLKPAMLADDYLLKYVGVNDRLANELEERFNSLKEDFDNSSDAKERAILSKAMTDIQREIRVITQGILDTGKDLGQIGDGKTTGKVQPVVIINNIPRPSLGVAEAPMREKRGDTYVTEYTVNTDEKK